MTFKRWEYQNGRPNLIAKIQNHLWAILHAAGLFPERFVTLEVVGRKSGKIIRFPLAMVNLANQRYLVSMLGKEANWVKNIQFANGKANLVHGQREQVFLHEVATELRAPILKAYLQIAPGARPHFPIDKNSPLYEFEKIASQYPVFRLEKVI
jgi:Domain of unknown function (DUF385).